MKMPSKKEIKSETEIIKKIYNNYAFLYANAPDENMRKRIQQLGSDHLVAKVQALAFTVTFAVDQQKGELKRLIEEEEKKKRNGEK